MMRILFLLTQDLESPSGIGRFFPLAKYLVRLGHQVDIVAPHSNYRNLVKKRFISVGVNIHYISQMHVLKKENRKFYYPNNKLIVNSLLETLALTKAALFSKADIIHIFKPHPMNSIAGLIAGKIRNAKICLDCDDYEAETSHFRGAWQKSLISYFEDKVPILVEHVTTHNQFLYERLVRLGVSKNKITYLPNGVDPDRFLNINQHEIENIRNALNLKGEKVVSFIGSLSSPSHPIDLLLEAFVQVQRNIPKSVLLIVGGGDEFLSLQNKVIDLGISEYSRFTGFIPPAQIATYYRLSDCIVDPVFDDAIGRSRLPLKLFESWICEVPFITADVGDRRLISGIPLGSLLVTPGSPSELANGIEKILTDSQLANRLRLIGLERVKEFYWSRLTKRLEMVYLNILNSPK